MYSIKEPVGGLTNDALLREEDKIGWLEKRYFRSLKDRESEK